MEREFSLAEVKASLARTPSALDRLLRGQPAAVANANEGAGTWSPLQVVQHLIWAEIDDWIPRARRIVEHGAELPFAPFDREQGFVRYAGWPLESLLDEFARLRAASLAELDAGLRLEPRHLALEGRHPEFGRVTMRQLLATWVLHDYAHLAQITRVITRHYGQFVGPWTKYFSLLAEPGAAAR